MAGRVTVFIWPKGRFGEVVRDVVVRDQDVGHVAIYFENQYISLWPERKLTRKDCGQSVRGVFHAIGLDIEREKSIPEVIYLDTLDTEKMKEAYELYCEICIKEGKVKYDLLSSSVDAVKNTINKAKKAASHFGCTLFEPSRSATSSKDKIVAGIHVTSNCCKIVFDLLKIGGIDRLIESQISYYKSTYNKNSLANCANHILQKSTFNFLAKVASHDILPINFQGFERGNLKNITDMSKYMQTLSVVPTDMLLFLRVLKNIEQTTLLNLNEPSIVLYYQNNFRTELEIRHVLFREIYPSVCRDLDGYYYKLNRVRIIVFMLFEILESLKVPLTNLRKESLILVANKLARNEERAANSGKTSVQRSFSEFEVLNYLKIPLTEANKEAINHVVNKPAQKEYIDVEYMLEIVEAEAQITTVADLEQQQLEQQQLEQQIIIQENFFEDILQRQNAAIAAYNDGTASDDIEDWIYENSEGDHEYYGDNDSSDSPSNSCHI